MNTGGSSPRRKALGFVVPYRRAPSSTNVLSRAKARIGDKPRTPMLAEGRVCFDGTEWMHGMELSIGDTRQSTDGKENIHQDLFSQTTK